MPSIEPASDWFGDEFDGYVVSSIQFFLNWFGYILS